MFSFPDARQHLTNLIDGKDFGFGAVTVYWQMSADFAKSLPALQIAQLPGQEEFLERRDRFRFSLYANGTDARNCLVAICDQFVGHDHAAPGVEGMVDSVAAEQTASDVPYASDRINQADAVLRTAVRAL